jgi:hypothetical protein
MGLQRMMVKETDSHPEFMDWTLVHGHVHVHVQHVIASSGSSEDVARADFVTVCRS